MSSWSKRRKSIITIVLVILLGGALGVPAFILLYNPPSCNDGMRNGNEQGVDCGGSCERLCQSAFLPPSVAWTRFEEVAPSLYNVAAYIVNPNTDAEARNIPYHFILYDTTGMIITEEAGTVTLPPHRNTLAFKGALDVGKRIPGKALFEFTQMPNWQSRQDQLASISVEDKQYTEDDLGSSLVVKLRNNSLFDIGKTAVYAILYDGSGNALGFSKTIIDELPAKADILAPFTWPKSRNGAVISIEVLPVAE